MSNHVLLTAATLEELGCAGVMKPVFSPDRLATTDLTHTIIGASDLTNSGAPDLCRRAPRREEARALRLAEVKRPRVLDRQPRALPAPAPACHPLPPSALVPCSVPRPPGQGSRAVCYHQGAEAAASPVPRRESGDRSGLGSLRASSSTREDARFGGFWGEWVAGGR